MAQTAFRVTEIVAGMTVVPGVESITQLIIEILSIAQQVKANKKSCEILADKVKVAQENLDKGISPSCGQEAIRAYIVALRKIEAFLRKKTRSCSKVKQFFTAKDTAKEVKQLIKELDQSSIALTLAVVRNIDLSRETSNVSNDNLKIPDGDIVDTKEGIPIVRGFQEVAEKKIGKLNENQTIDKNFWEEIEIWKQLGKAPGILKFYGIVERNGEMFTISEWANNSDLESYFKIENPKLRLGWDQKNKIASQVAAALAHCHNMDILHHDVRR
ncbi:hypothetical protein G9A89_001638 [Geosiphon pyriformis]|nr:hypothetical protein G9A89_001638 [Geosiphon pyriformis]